LKKSFIILTAFLMVFLSLAPAFATTYTWQGGGADNNTTTGSNWVGGVYPPTPQTTVFATGGSSANVIVPAWENSQVIFNSSNNFTITATGIGVFGIGYVAPSTDGILAQNPDTTSDASSRTYAISAPVKLYDSQTWTVSNNGVNLTTLAVSGVISGNYSLIKAGSGTLLLSTNNTYTGSTTVNGGTLITAAGNTTTGALGASSSIIVNNGGTISTQGTDNSFVGYATSGTKTIQINTGGLVTNASGTTNHLNALVMNGGTLSVTGTSNGNYGNWNFDYGVSTLGNGNTSTITGGNAALSETGGTVFNIQTNDTVDVSTVLFHSTTIADNGLIKEGGGTLLLSGANTYTSSTTLSAGTLQIGVASIGSVSSITSSAIGTGTLALNGGEISSDSTTARTIYNAVTVGGNTTLGDATNNGVLTFAGAGTLNGNYTLTVDSNVVYSGAIGDGNQGYGITKAGSGTLTLSGDNTYSGTTNINDGTLFLASNLTSSAINFTGNGTAEFAAGINDSTGITTSVAHQGIVIFDSGNNVNPTHTISADIGTASAPVDQVLVGTYNTYVNSNIYASLFTFSGNGGYVAVADGKSITASITENVDGSSTINYLGSTTISDSVGTSSSKLAYIDFNSGIATLGANLYTDPASQGGTGSTNVGSGATLALNGSRTISGALNLFGGSTLNLGTNTLTNSGIYTQNSGSTLALTINSLSSYGVVNATSATLNTGAKVSVTVAGNNYIPNNASFTIINAGTGVYNLTSNNLTSAGDSRVTFTATVSGNDLILVANRTASGFAPLANNSNAHAAGLILDSFTNPTGNMLTSLNALEGLSNAQVTAALNTLTPVVDAGVREDTAAVLNNFIGASIDRAQNVLSGVSAGDSPELNGIWAKEYGSYLNQGNDQGVSGYNAWNTGTAVGVDHLFGDSLTVGISGGYAYGSVTSAANYGDTNINSAQSTLYAGYQNPEHPYFIDLAGSSAWNWYSAQRNIAPGSLGLDAASNYRGEQYGTYINGGYNFNISNKLQLTPLASLQWDHLALGHYTEIDAGALDLHVNRQSYDMLESGLGLRVSVPEIKRVWGNIAPEVHVKWLHDFISDGMSVTSSYTGGGGSFSTHGIKPPMNGVDLGGKITFDLKHDISIIFGIDTELKDHLYAVGGTAEVRYRF